MITKLKILFLFFFLNIEFSQAQNLTSGLIAYFPFNGSATDASGNNNHGTSVGTSLTEDRFGNSNSAYSFNGTSDYVTTPVTNIGSGKITISAWIKTSGPVNSAYYGIVTSRTAFNKLNGLSILNNAAGYSGKKIFTDVNNGNQAVNQIFADGTTATDNNWHFLVYSYDGTTQSIYIDGSLAENGAKNVLQVIGAPFVIGNDNLSGASRFFKGSIDDVRIYDRALTESEINMLKNELPSNCTQNITVTDTLVINLVITGYNPITYNTAIKVYPNPSKGTITIDYGDVSKINGYKISIKNSAGNEVYFEDIKIATTELNLSTWTGTGMYFLYIYDSIGGMIDVRKIVLQ